MANEHEPVTDGCLGPGTAQWLIKTEKKYGGRVTGVPRNRVSSLDPRTKEQVRRGGMSGGDRMLHHRYAHKYSEYMLPYMKQHRNPTVSEIGILLGTGLAIWCDLFPSGRILGFDIDLEHVKGNMPALRAMGAFRLNSPEIFEFDQFMDNREYLASVLNGDTIDICIDDGFHSNQAALQTMKSVLPHLSSTFTYIIEDNRSVHRLIRKEYPDFTVDVAGSLTIITG